MRAYLALFRARFSVLLQYRAAALAGFGTQLLFGFVRVMILQAFYGLERAHEAGGSAVPMTLAQAVSYTWLGQAMFHLLPYSSNPDPDVSAMIRSGEVAYELARPLDLHTLWLTRSLAARMAPTLMRAAPMLIVAGALLGLQGPASAAQLLAACLALAAAVALTASFSTVITSLLMWTVSGDGIARLAPSLVMIGAGLVIPLPLFPDWVQPLFDLLPFRGMADDPFRLYLGLLPATHVATVLARQIVWTALFVLLGRLLVARGQRKLVVQGG